MSGYVGRYVWMGSLWGDIDIVFIKGEKLDRWLAHYPRLNHTGRLRNITCPHPPKVYWRE
jgi:hypothetical protein